MTELVDESVCERMVDVSECMRGHEGGSVYSSLYMTRQMSTCRLMK